MLLYLENTLKLFLCLLTGVGIIAIENYANPIVIVFCGRMACPSGSNFDIHEFYSRNNTLLCVSKDHASEKTTMQKSFKLDQAFMNNVEKTSNCIFMSGRLSLRYFEYVNTLLGSISSQIIEYQQITSAKYTVLMLRVRQNERKQAFGRSPPYQE